MKYFTTSIAIILLSILLTMIPFTSFARQEEQFVPGEILVKFKDGTLDKDSSRLHSTLKTIKKKHLRKLKLHHLKLPKNLPVKEAVRKYQQDPNVEYAEPNYIVHAMATTPNDTLFLQLWGLNSNQDYDIDAPEAWDITTGSDNVVIAVIDSGLAYNHPEFATNLWTNDIELAGTALNDDDGNGYDDDFYGWDFVDNDGLPLDMNDHGTHVSGTIAAQGDNGLGVTGVLWNAKIMPVRFLGLSGSGSTFDAISAIKYAYDNGARIMNNSWGGGSFSQSLKDIIEIYAADALFIFSAGNSGQDTDTSPTYPASYDSHNIISVAATDSSDSLASFSNFGATTVDLAAPGVSILSSIPLYTYGTKVIAYPPSGTKENFDASVGELPLLGWDRGGTNPSSRSWTVTEQTGVGSSNSLEDSPDGNYARNTFSWAGFMTPIDSSIKGRRYLLTFSWKGALEQDWDWLDIIYSTDGSNWDWIDYRTGNQPNFTTYTADYTAVAETFDSFYFGFRIDSDNSIEKEGVYLDNITMTMEDISISSYSYTWFNGTSMAAPHVSGVAGLLLANNPALTNLELKDIILNSVDPVAGLSGLVLTGGRLNAHAALLGSGSSPATTTTTTIPATTTTTPITTTTTTIPATTTTAPISTTTTTMPPTTTTTINPGTITTSTTTSTTTTSTTTTPTIPIITTTTVPARAAGGGGGGGCFIETATN